MKKPSRPSFFRHLDEDYARRRAAAESETARKGVINMSIRTFSALAIFFVLLACAGSAAATYTVIDVAGDGPQGGQGVQGPPGQKGDQGVQGIQGVAGNDASQQAIKRLAGLWAVQQESVVEGGTFVSLNDPIVGSCVQYVLTGSPGTDACPGFTEGQ